MYVHHLKLLQDHYYIISLSYCHGTAYYYLITTKRLFLALALVTAAVPGTGQALTGWMSSRYKHRTGISNPCGHLCQWTWTTVTGLLVTRADSAAEKWPGPWQQCQCCCNGQKFCLASDLKADSDLKLQRRNSESAELAKASFSSFLPLAVQVHWHYDSEAPSTNKNRLSHEILPTWHNLKHTLACLNYVHGM